MRLPDGTGLELVREVAGQGRGTPIAVITAYGSAENAVIALKAGAFDYVSKPVVLDNLRAMVRSALRLSATAAGRAAGPGRRRRGVAPARGARRRCRRCAPRSAGWRARRRRSPSTANRAAARSWWRARSTPAARAPASPSSPSTAARFPRALLESEFFGYRKGAFTGAADDRDGFFQAANGGTLFLDEIGDLPLAMQVKLLRAIQERRVRKIGATAEEPVDVRIISATHKDLGKLVETGQFRQDLFYRLNVIELTLPPLRERLDDLPLLADAILVRLAGPGNARLGAGVLDALQGYAFPGNVRELENVLERALAFANDGVIEVGDLLLKGARLADQADVPAAPAPAATPTAIPAATPATPAATSAAPDDGLPTLAAGELPSNLPDYLNQVERDIILRALHQTQFNRTQAATLLGISVRQLRYQMQKLDIHAPEP